MGSTKINTELVNLLKQGDIEAFDKIYNIYCHKLHQFVLRYLKQEEDAEEIVQEVFIKIWESRKKIDVHASFEAYLFTISYNSTISLLRKRISESKSREYLKSVQEIQKANSVIDDLQYNELNDKVQSLLQQLTPRQKEIYMLSREEGLSHKEIAARLNISENTVKNHLVTTLKFLKSNLDTGLVVNALFFYLFF
ncbi:RNA polymerase sigma-70 factor [Draconibacterium sp. IB214405]|uniref:RNA polymerase sigma factor n=1 Tax=Draconibacterium sp. IB214405 TaxID=3097352 RepID=UPI002A16578A|nr:RNA polymerase sigma-70 factor [Draconibacterium sp. IB214405]MDX8339372.1 RNA polymerase sigma-70 factor [Draconibacterium sp. IB214405]